MSFRALSVCLLLTFLLAAAVVAQTAPVVRSLGRELAEALGQRSARELAEAGGEAAVRATVEKAAREGGEQLAREVATYGQRYGAQALRAFADSPAAMVSALRKVPSEFTEGVMRAAAREPEVIAKLGAELGEDALIVAAKHPGVGVDIARKLGREGCAIARQIPTSDAIRLAKLSDDLARLPAAERAGLLSRMQRAPGKVIDYLEKHPIVFGSAAVTTAYLATAYLAIDALLGDAQSPGFLERMSDKFRFPLALVIGAVALFFLVKAALLFRRRRAARTA